MQATKKEKYQYTVEDGDMVKLPNGTIGIVSNWYITCGGNVEVVNIYPFTNWLNRMFLFFTGKLTYYDDDINKLQKLYGRQFRD